MDNDKLIDELKILISDLKYEPFELAFKDNNFKILNDKKLRRIIFKNLRPTNDYEGFIGQCEELANVTIKRIRKKFPNLRIQQWRGCDNLYFQGENHTFILIKNSYFKRKNILVDPSFQKVDFENKFNYSKFRLQYDSKKNPGVISYLDGIVPYNCSTPIFYDKETKKLFFLFYDYEHKNFTIFDGMNFISNLEELRILTKNKRFLLFCKKLNTYRVEDLDYDFKPEKKILYF